MIKTLVLIVTKCKLARLNFWLASEIWFIIDNAAMAALETMAFISNGVSLFSYFYGYMNFSLTKSAITLTNFMGTAFLLPLVGGFISDTYLSKFKTCLVFGCLEVLVSVIFHQSQHIVLIWCNAVFLNE